MVRVAQTRLERELFIEGLRVVVLRMHREGPGADALRGLCGAKQCVLEERGAEPATVNRHIDRLPSDQNDRSRMTDLPLPDAFWGLVVGYGTGG